MGKKRLKKSKVEAQPSVMAAAVPLSVETNEGFDRRMTVTGKITEGTIPLTSSFTITQLGLREPFIPSDSDGQYGFGATLFRSGKYYRAEFRRLDGFRTFECSRRTHERLADCRNCQHNCIETEWGANSIM